MFNPHDNKIIMSTGDKDGIYFWSFYGDTTSKFVHDDAEQDERDEEEE